MPALQNITNENKIIEDKVNYFIDRFNHTNSYGGYGYQFELETQHSLIEKIYYNLDTDTALRFEIFEIYFSHEIIHAESLWKELPIYPRVFGTIKNFQAAERRDKLSILDKASFRRDLKLLLDELCHRSPSMLFNALMSIIQCPYPLAEHNHIEKLDTISRLIVAESLFSGKTRAEVAAAVNNIFMKDQHAFPFPKEVKVSERKAYLLSNNLHNQLSGFKSMMEPNIKSGQAIVRIYGNLVLPDDFEFSYNGVQFLGIGQAKIRDLGKDLPDKDYFRNFMEPDGFIFAVCKIEYFSYSSIRTHANREISPALVYLNAVLGGAMQQEQADNYIVVNSRWKLKEYNLSLFKSRQKIDAYHLKELMNNPIELLKSVRKSDAKEWFLRHEPLYIQTFQNHRVSDYWQYLEALLPKDVDGQKQIKTLLSNILIINERENVDFRVKRTLSSAVDFFNNGNKLFNIPYERLHDAQRQLSRGKIPKEIENSKYPFVVKLLEEMKNSNNREELKEAKDYYHRILVEAYNVRNFDVHAGIVNFKATLKVSGALPRMIARLRWLIMDGIKADHSLPFHLLISNLNAKALQILADKS